MPNREYLKTITDKELLSFMPRILDTADDKVWVENVIDLGDLIERQMGTDTSELYFSIISDFVFRILYGNED